MNYRFNATFFFNLPNVIGIKNYTFCEAIGVPRSTLFYYKRRNDMPLMRFVSACNNLRLSAARFIVPEGEPLVVPGSGDVAGVKVDEEKFKRVEFRCLEFGVFVTACQVRSIAEACKALGIGYGKFKRNFIEAATYDGLMIGEFLGMCAKVGASPLDYIVDPNSGDDVVVDEPTMEDWIESKNKQIMDLQRRNKDLLTRIKNLTAENKRLRELVDGGCMMVAESVNDNNGKGGGYV